MANKKAEELNMKVQDQMKPMPITMDKVPIHRESSTAYIPLEEDPSYALSRYDVMKHIKETLYTETQKKIIDVMKGMERLLLYKNSKYGDSAINPKKIFYKGDSTNSILIRLDDKIGRVMSNTDEKPRVNDVADIIGYCTLLLISMGVTAEDLEKFMD